MVQFRYRTPFGIPVTPEDAAVALRELRLADRFASVTREAVIHALRTSLRDQGLRRSSGRWNDGDRDPFWFLPGDIAALRAIATHRLTAGALRFKVEDRPGAGSVTSLADIRKLLRAPAPTSLLVDVYRAVPRFIPAPATAALLATRPPTTQDLAAVRLPAARTLVVFGADLSLDQRAYAWPEEAIRQLPPDNIAWEISLRGGAVSGVLLLADATGRLQDECIWLLVANPNTRQPFPRSVDHVRTVLRGWRSQAQLGHLADRAAAAVAGAAWKLPLASPDNLGLPVGPHTARSDQLQAEQWFRGYEREGGAVQAWVLDLEETRTRAALTTRRPLEAGAREAAEAGEFATTARRYQDPQVIWVPPPGDDTAEPPGPEQLTLSHPPATLDKPTHPPAAGRSRRRPGPHRPRGTAPGARSRRQWQGPAAAARQRPGHRPALSPVRARRPGAAGHPRTVRSPLRWPSAPPSTLRRRHSSWGSALHNQVTSIKAHIEVEEQRERARVRPRQRLTLPSPRPAAAAIAVTAVEVRAGIRAPWHLERVSHYSLWSHWDHFAQPGPPNPAATAAVPLTVLIQEWTPGLVNATVTVRFAGTVEPVALALDGARGWWELMELECSANLTHRPLLQPPTPTTPTIEELGRPPPIHRPPGWPLPTALLPPPRHWPPPELATPVDPYDGPDIDLT